MTAEWTFTDTPYGVLVSVLHNLRLRWPLFADFVSGRIIEPYFVDPISAGTLHTIGKLAESEPEGQPGPSVTLVSQEQDSENSRGID
jgi:hypothetical protein